MGERKTRSDKKVDVRPTVPIDLFACVSNISVLTNQPIKDVAEYLCIKGFYTNNVIDSLSDKFKRDFNYKNTIFRGNKNLIVSRRIKLNGHTHRMTIRFEREFNDHLALLSFVMDCTVSKAVTLLLHASLTIEIVTEYIRYYIERPTSQDKILLKEIDDYIQ